MHEIFTPNRSVLSLEFFPPDDIAGFEAEVENLKRITPDWVSVTCGAGGSNRDRTAATARKLSRSGLTVTAHLTCRGAGRDQIAAMLDDYVQSEVRCIMALGGDKPWDGGGDFTHAADLVAFIGRQYPHLSVGVAGYPEGHPATPNRLKELDYLKAKVDAGADFIVTQLCLDNRHFFDFCERCRLAGINVPIVAGIMPLRSLQHCRRMAELTGGCNFPARLQKAFARAQTPAQMENVGVHWAAEQVRDLLDHAVAGIHLYTMNRSSACLGIFERLGILSG